MIIPKARVDRATSFLRRTTGREIELDAGVVLGTGFADFAESLDVTARFNYCEIPNFPTTTIEGHPGILVIARHEAGTVAVMQGRVHLYEGLKTDEMMLPIAVLRSLGCRTLLLTSAAGGLDPAMRPGDLMIISDHINMTGANPLAGTRDTPGRPCFLDVTDLYDPEIRAKAKEIAKERKIPLREGVYLGVRGPSYETPAEIRAFRGLDADAIGMSTVIEALYARYLGMKVFGLSCISNVPVAGTDGGLTHCSVQDVVSKSLPDAAVLLHDLMGRICL